MIISRSSNGFLSVLGALPVQLAMLVAFLSTVSVPQDEEGEYDADFLFTYHLVWIMHLAMVVTLLLNQYFSEKLGVARMTLNTCMMLFQVLVLIYVYAECIFPDPEPDVLEASGEAGTEDG